MYQTEFINLVDVVEKRCKKYFKDRLTAIYITGSVASGEAIFGVSDLDYWGFISDEVSDSDKRWIEENAKSINDMHHEIDGVHIHIESLNTLRQDKFMRFALRYNSFLHFGIDVITKMELEENIDKYLPNAEIATMRLSFARNCFLDAMKGICPQCMDKIPENTFLASRKFARYFIIIEGAYFLMTLGKFENFNKSSVIPLLKENSRGFDNIIDIAQEVLEDTFKANITHSDFLQMIYPFVTWMFNQIERTSKE